MKPYVPQPGTIPNRVIEHLKRLSPDTELATAVLAEIVGQDTKQMAACLASPRKHGALIMRKREDGIHVWSLGSGKPTPLPPDHTPDEPLHPVPKTPAKPASPFDLRKPRALTPREAKPTPPADPPPAPDTYIGIPISTITAIPAPEPIKESCVRFGYFSDGCLIIEKIGNRIGLTEEEAQNLIKFIQKHAQQ
jgi:hypothetical protein